MNAVEIEEAVSNLAETPFDAVTFPFSFLEAFGNKETTIKRLQSGASNQTDVTGGVLQRSNIHLAVCSEGKVAEILTALRESPATKKYKVNFILATDGKTFEAENIADGETIACDYVEFADHFGFFLALAGISTVKQIRENAFDIKATSRLNRLYVELLKTNPDWDTAERREEMNHFMARLIFCFFAEDTNIFSNDNLFTETISTMTESDASNTHEVLAELFKAMNTPLEKRQSAGIRNWSKDFPYVNGGLFSGRTEAPKFSKIARSYLLHVGNLDWTKINPDIFGSMIQAVADVDERGELGMHYTSVPNILKVLNPLFLDDLNQQLEEAGDNSRKLLNLRQRMARIRVFDPACGSGNFLVIAYKEMRKIEAEINRRRKELDRHSDIPITNFRGIELRHFSAEIARLSLVIAEYQTDVLYRGLRLALAEFLPLKIENWITCGNALRLDWLKICPPSGTGVKVHAENLFSPPQAQIDFENEGGETYICGNPPYIGSGKQTDDQKEDLKHVFDNRTKSWKSLDYVAGWFMKAVDYGAQSVSSAAFVTTNSICQGQQVAILWPLIFATGHEILFAYTSFKWANLASNNAGVTVAVIGISKHAKQNKQLFSTQKNQEVIVKEVAYINAYLVSGQNIIVEKSAKPLNNLSVMNFGNKAVDGGNLILSSMEVESLKLSREQFKKFVLRHYGSAEFIQGVSRYCLWIHDEDLEEALAIESIRKRIEAVEEVRLASRDKSANDMASRSHQFREMYKAKKFMIVIPRVTSENRPYLPVGILDDLAVVGDRNFALYDPPIWNMAIVASRLHWVWIDTVCGKLRTDFNYSNTIGWNTFPIPTLTEQNKADLTQCAEDILLAREHYFPATLADMYDPERMNTEFPLVREAHERNDEVLERIYIGRRFKNDTERLEKLFELYTKMTTKKSAKSNSKGDDV